MHSTQIPKVLAALLILFALLISFFPAPFTLASGRPVTLPALKEWSDNPGAYTFSASSRVVLASAYASQLSTAGAVFADDLRFLTGWTIPVVTANRANLGDIFLTLNSTDPTLGAEGYQLTITDRVILSARNDAGAFYGTRTMLQLLRQNYTLSAGTARDWPDYPERGLMIDVGRKYYSVPWLQNQIKDLAYQKLNYLHLHLSDDQGFRLESASHPEIVSAQHYSKADITALIQLGQKYHVTIIPEIDLPGHATTILANHPELQLVSKTHQTDPSKLDLSKDAAYTLVNDLLQEYLPLFPAPYWHIGADEYIPAVDFAKYPQLETYAKAHYGPTATGYDTYLGFVNWVNTLVKAQDKRLRAWADPYEYLAFTGTAVGLDPDITLDVWNAYQNPQQITDAGYFIQNSSFHPTYYVLGSYRGDPVTLYENWAPHDHFGGWEPTYPNWSIAPLHPKLLGAKIAVWSENPTTELEDQVADGIKTNLRGLAHNSWGAAKLVSTYGDFVTYVVNPIRRAPGYWGMTGSERALKKTAAASSTYQTNTAANAVDGNSFTPWWSSAAAPQTIEVDLGATYNVSGVALTWSGTTDYARAYQVQTKLNATDTWATVFTASGATGGQQNHTFAAVVARYVRLNITDSGGNWVQLYDLQVFGTPTTLSNATSTPVLSPTATPNTPDLAMNKVATANSTYNTYVAGNAVDGNSNTQWWSSAAATTTKPKTLGVDLGAVYSFSRVKIKWGLSDYAKAYQLRYRNKTNEQWTAILSITGATGLDQEHTFSPVNARYVQIYATDSGGNWLQVYNYEIYAQ